MALKWHEQANIIASKSTAVVNKAKSAWADMERAQEARRREQEVEERAKKQQQMEMVRVMNEMRQREKVAAYAEEKGVSLTPGEIASGVSKRVNWYAAIDTAVKEREIAEGEARNEAIAEQQKDEAKLREKVTKDLIKAGKITADISDEVREQYIREATYRERANEALIAGDTQASIEYTQAAEDIVAQLDAYFKAVKAAEPVPWYKEPFRKERWQPYPWTKEALPHWAELLKWTPPQLGVQALRALGKGIEIVDIPFQIKTHSEILKRKEETGADLSLEEKQFLDVFRKEVGEPQKRGGVLDALATGIPPWAAFRMWGGAPLKPSEELKESYYASAGIGKQLAESLTTPLMVALITGGALGGATGLKAKLAAKPGVAARLGEVAVSPIVGYEWAAGKVLTLPIKGASALTNKTLQSYVNKNARYISLLARRQAKNPFERLLQKVIEYHGNYITRMADNVAKARSAYTSAKAAGDMASKTAAQKETLLLESKLRASTRTMDNIVSAVRDGKELSVKTLTDLIVKNTPDDFVKGITGILGAKVGVEVGKVAEKAVVAGKLVKVAVSPVVKTPKDFEALQAKGWRYNQTEKAWYKPVEVKPEVPPTTGLVTAETGTAIEWPETTAAVEDWATSYEDYKVAEAPRVMPEDRVKPPEEVKSHPEAIKEIDKEFYDAIENSPLDKSATIYWKDGNFDAYVRQVPELGELKLQALTEEAKANISELETLRDMALAEITDIEGSVTSTFRPVEARAEVRKLEADAKYFRALIKKIKGGVSLTAEDATKLGIALRLTKGGKLAPAIRKSGYFTTREFAEYPNFRDLDYRSGNWMDPDHLFRAIDNGVRNGPAQKFILWPTKRSYLAELRFIDDAKYHIQSIEKQAGVIGRKDLRKSAGEVIESISKDDAQLPLNELLQKPEIRKLVSKYGLKDRQAIVKFAREGRRIFDDLIDKQNAIRAKRGQEVIEYRQNYRPWVAETNIWSHTFGLKKTPADVIKKPELPDYIKPIAPFNPRAMAREGGMRGYEMEKDLQKLLLDYTETAGRDIFNTNIIHNAKIHAATLQSMGFSNSARLVEDWAVECYAGVRPMAARGIRAIVPKPVISAALRERRFLTRAVFPLNWTWNLFIQTSSLGLTISRFGLKNTTRGMAYLFMPSVKDAIRKNAYSLIIKGRRGGKVAYQDIGMQTEKTLKIEESKLERAEDAANLLTTLIEEKVTGISIEAGRQDGIARLGLKGRELWEYASTEGGARTQSMYNLQDLPGVLRSKEMGAIAPFQTFSFECLNLASEIAGVRGLKTEKVTRRLKMLIEWIASMVVVNIVVDKAINRKPWRVSSFLPFYSLFTGGMSSSNWGQPLPFQYLGDFWNGANALLKYGNWRKLRKWVIRYHMLAGTQVERMIEGIEAVSEGKVTDIRGRTLFEVKPEEWLTAITKGPYQTAGGREYIERLQEAKGPLSEYTELPLPRLETMKLNRLRDKYAKQWCQGRKWVEISSDEKRWLLDRFPELKGGD